MRRLRTWDFHPAVGAATAESRKIRSALGRMLLVPTVVCIALAAAACGGGPPAGVADLGSTTTTAPASGGTLLEYTSCMRAHGVLNFPDSSSFGSSAAIKAAKGQMAEVTRSEAASPSFEAAQRSCARYAGQWGQSSARVSPQRMRRLLAVSRCMRSHGVANYPDPNPITGEIGRPVGVSANSPVVVAALRACASLGRAAGLGPPNTGQ